MVPLCTRGGNVKSSEPVCCSRPGKMKTSSCRDRVRVYQGAGGRDGEETANSAQRLNEEWGFTAFKLSPFRLSPDVARWGRICA